MSSFDHYLDAVMTGAAVEARADGSAAVEAQHLLLGVARQGSPVLAAAGLDRAAIRAALDREFARSLAAAGVRLDSGLPPATADPSAAAPGLGAGARAALERGLAAAHRRRDLRPEHLLLGIVTARTGTVPRALALAGVEPATLVAAIDHELGGGPGE